MVIFFIKLRGVIEISGIGATLIFIIVVTLYLLVIEVFYTIFRFTGLNKEKARFQSITLLTTVGYSTSESEDVLTSQVRRRVAMVGMLFGYMFSVVIASSIINIVNGFIGKNNSTNIVNILIMVFAIVIMFFLTRSKTFTRLLNKIIKGRIESYISKRQEVNPLYVLDTHGKYVVCEVFITKRPEELRGKTLVEAEVRQKFDISVLTLKRDNVIRTIDANKDTIERGDRLIVFGDIEKIKTLFHSDIL